MNPTSCSNDVVKAVGRICSNPLCRIKKEIVKPVRPTIIRKVVSKNRSGDRGSGTLTLGTCIFLS